MTSFLETVRKADGQRRFYVGGCRVSKSTFHSVGDGNKSCFHTSETKTHWNHRHERRL
jgi:hypothetical protein